MEDDLLEIARIKAPNGLKGKMLVTPVGAFSDQFNQYAQLIISRQGLPRKVRSCCRKKNRFVLELEGITSLEQVELLRGEALYVRREWLPETEADEYYVHDLVGLEVVDLAGRSLGRLVDVFPTGSNDVLVVDEEKQILLPYTDEVVREVDLDRGVLIVDTALVAELLEE